MADQARLIGNNGKRRIIAHAANRFFAILNHRRKDQFHILKRLPRRNLAAGEFGAIITGDGFALGFRQISKRAETFDHISVRRFARDPVFDGAVFKKFAGIEINRDHLSGAEPPLGNHCRLGHDDHSGFRTNDQEIIIGAGVTQRTQRVAVNACNRPAPLGHCKCSRAIPRLHYASEIGVHIAVVLRHIGLGLPRFGDQHELGRRRIAT